MSARMKKSLPIAAFLAAAALSHGVAQAEDIVIVSSSSFSTLDPHQAISIQPDMSAISHIYSPLVIRGNDLELHGVVAESWEAVDELTWSFKLRPDIRFSSGEALDADVVKWNFDRILDPDFQSRTRAWYQQIQEVKVISPTEVQIVTSAPSPSLPAQLAMFFLLPPEWTEAHNPSIEANGSGPYEVVSYTPGERLVLKARPDYFGEKPAFDNVEIRTIVDPSARIAALLAGEVDIVGELPPSELDRITQSNVADAGWADAGRMLVVRFNTEKEPLAGNVALRQALNYAIDKQMINDGLYGGLATPSRCQLMTSAYFGYNPDLEPYAYDPEKARELIAQSGVSQPITLEFEVPTGRYLLAEETAQVVASQLSEVGIQVQLKEMDFATWLGKYGRKDMGQLSIMTQGWTTLDADGLLSLYEPSYPSSYWHDAEFLQLIGQARVEMDESKRLELYKSASERMCEQAPVVFMFAPPVTYGTSKRIEWQPRPDDWVRAFDAGTR